MVNERQVVAQVSQALLAELTEDGTRDLTQMRLADIENEVYSLVDKVGGRLVRGLLEDQANEASADACPVCGRTLQEKPPEEKLLMLRRGEVAWQQPVTRCQECRRDFFPSSGDAGN